MVVFSSEDKGAQVGTYGAVYWASTAVWLKRLSFVTFYCSSCNMSPWACLEDADSDYKETMQETL